MSNLVQFDIFGNQETIDTEKERQKALKKKQRSAAAKKAAETRRNKQQAARQEWNKNLITARETENGNLFGEKSTDEEKRKAEQYIQTYDRNGKLRKPSNESLESRLRNIISEEIHNVITEILL